MFANPSPRCPPCPSAARDLGALARAFETAQAQLDMVSTFAEATRGCPSLGSDQDLYFQGVCERLTTRILGAMLGISEAASLTPARTPAELSAKASIWLGRHIPEPDNDVLALAVSICRDLTALSGGEPAQGR